MRGTKKYRPTNDSPLLLKDILSLNNTAAIRLLQLLKLYNGKFELTLTQLHDIFGKPDRPFDYNKFKMTVLLNQQKYLKDNSDVTFSFTEEIENGEVVKLRIVRIPVERENK